MALLASFVFGFVPMFVFAYILYWLDRYEKEPLWLLAAVFGWGMCILLQHYHFIRLDPNVFYISALPVKIVPSDIGIIIVSSLALCVLATIYPSSQASRMDPALASFFREYLEGEKAVEFGGKLVLNSHELGSLPRERRAAAAEDAGPRRESLVPKLRPSGRRPESRRQPTRSFDHRRPGRPRGAPTWPGRGPHPWGRRPHRG